MTRRASGGEDVVEGVGQSARDGEAGLGERRYRLAAGRNSVGALGERYQGLRGDQAIDRSCGPPGRMRTSTASRPR